MSEYIFNILGNCFYFHFDYCEKAIYLNHLLKSYPFLLARCLCAPGKYCYYIIIPRVSFIHKGTHFDEIFIKPIPNSISREIWQKGNP